MFSVQINGKKGRAINTAAGWRVLPMVTSIAACLTEPDNKTTSLTAGFGD
jgi:hypothetical protein